MANSQTVWKGTTVLKDDPSSPLYELTKDGERWTIIKQGPYQTCLGSRPQRLQSIGGYDNVVVDTVRVEKGAGGTGKLAITLCPAPTEGVDGPSGQAETYEIEWIEVQQKLELHPRYNEAIPNVEGSGVKKLTDEDRTNIECWRNEPDPKLRKDYKFKNPAGSGVTLSDNAKDFAMKVLAGTDSCTVYAPLARVTANSRVKPQTGKCGYKDNPPDALYINPYYYFKTADRAVKQDRKWQRVQEWTGALKIDDDLYDWA